MFEEARWLLQRPVHVDYRLHLSAITAGFGALSRLVFRIQSMSCLHVMVSLCSKDSEPDAAIDQSFASLTCVQSL